MVCHIDILLGVIYNGEKTLIQGNDFVFKWEKRCEQF